MVNKQKEKGEVLSLSKGQTQYQNLGTTTKLSAGHGKFDAGQAMVEAMVALSVIVVALLSVFTLTTQSLGLNRVAADRYVAVNLANEGIELTKNLIDKNVMGHLSSVPWNKDVDEEGVFEIDYNDQGLALLTSLNDENSAKESAQKLYFSKDPTGGFYRYDNQDLQKGVITDFKRIIKVQKINPNHLHIVSRVFWISRGASYEFSVEDNFYNLQEFKYNNNQ